jgi:hypothetical protein
MPNLNTTIASETMDRLEEMVDGQIDGERTTKASVLDGAVRDRYAAWVAAGKPRGGA